MLSAFIMPRQARLDVPKTLHRGLSEVEVARHLGVTTSSVNRLAVSPKIPDLKKFLTAP